MLTVSKKSEICLLFIFIFWKEWHTEKSLMTIAKITVILWNHTKAQKNSILHENLKLHHLFVSSSIFFCFVLYSNLKVAKNKSNRITEVVIWIIQLYLISNLFSRCSLCDYCMSILFHISNRFQHLLSLRFRFTKNKNNLINWEIWNQKLKFLHVSRVSQDKTEKILRKVIDFSQNIYKHKKRV